jgi:hypothetical protein
MSFKEHRRTQERGSSEESRTTNLLTLHWTAHGLFLKTKQPDSRVECRHIHSTLVAFQPDYSVEADHAGRGRKRASRNETVSRPKDYSETAGQMSNGGATL